MTTRSKVKDAELTRAEINLAKELLERTLRLRALPIYSTEERLVLAILAANYSQIQRGRGKKSKGHAKVAAEQRRGHVNVLLRYVVDKKYRKNPTSGSTVQIVWEWLHSIGIKASASKVRRDIEAVLKLGPLPTS